MTDDWMVSLNEIEGMSAKAIRGAGAGWGVAEDIARAARWMAARNLDWSGPLLRLLDDPAVADHLRPAFQAADLLHGAGPGAKWRIEGCEPAWVLAILSAALHDHALALHVAWDAAEALLHPDGALGTTGPCPELAELRACPITVRVVQPPAPLRHVVGATTRRGTVSRNAWRALDAFAARTYVAASAQSRAGAGGGRVDAD